MKQFILREPPGAGGIIHLYGEDYRYLARVRRLRPGSVFNAALPDGKAARVTVLSTVDNILIGQCEGAGEKEAAPVLPPLYLFQGLPRGAKMDLIARQAAEGGVAEVAPFEAEYSTVKIKDAERKKTRWERVVREARQQSGSAAATVIRPPVTFGALLEYWNGLLAEHPGGVGILLHQDPLARNSLHEYLYKRPEFVALAVGPEGGFSPNEVRRFLDAGFRPAVIGAAILRTETAALAGAAAVRIILLERATWELTTTETFRPPVNG